ncbi:hypothetical protein LSAT2_029976 [Lamellibrachia satsuma]|nr:hypothetical protein LSAT2_029976 [Lamellibrachia satsuma]
MRLHHPYLNDGALAFIVKSGYAHASDNFLDGDEQPSSNPYCHRHVRVSTTLPHGTATGHTLIISAL